MNGRPSRTTLSAVATAIWVVVSYVASAAAATEYTFTKIADTAQYPNAGLNGVSCVGMNNNGVVIVHVSSGRVFSGDGQSFTSVVDSAGVICPSINDTGEIAHSIYSNFVTSLVRNDNGFLTTLARSDQAPYLDGSSNNYLPSLSNNGSAVYRANGVPGSGAGAGLYIGPGAIPVCTNAMNGAVQLWSTASMNDNLVVAFVALRVDNINGSRWGVYRGSCTPLIEDQAAVSGGTVRVGLNRPVINNAGSVAFVGSLNGVSGVYTTDDGVNLTFAGTGGLQAGHDRISLNSYGVVAFDGTLAAGSNVGLFVGAQAPATPVIRAGDTLDGAVVQGVFMWEESLNDKGQLAFWVQLSDGRSGVYRAEPVNQAPVAADDTLVTDEDTQASGTLDASDADQDGLTFSIVTNGAKGVATVTNSTTGEFTFTPNPDANGSDNFTFKANDGQVDSNTATVSVTINPKNDAPVAADGSASVNAGALVSGTLIATDIDSASLSYSIVSNGTQGTATITDAATGAFSYTANVGANVSDTFTFHASDGSLFSNTATVTVTISPPACVVNVTSQVGITRGSFRLARKSGTYSQKVTLRNTSANTISGPVYLALDALASGITLLGSDGVTACAAPGGSPYIAVNVGADGVFSSAERATVTLRFAGTSAITYVPRVLAGTGAR